MFASLDIRLITAFLAAVACGGALLLGFASPSPGAARPQHYVVRSGDTLWRIALVRYPQSDTRDAVYRIQQANGLPGVQLAVGQELELP